MKEKEEPYCNNPINFAQPFLHLTQATACNSCWFVYFMHSYLQTRLHVEPVVWLERFISKQQDLVRTYTVLLLAINRISLCHLQRGTSTIVEGCSQASIVFALRKAPFHAFHSWGQQNFSLGFLDFVWCCGNVLFSRL